MASFRGFLIAAWAGLCAYTGVVIVAHGIDLLPLFFGDIAKAAWPGQFNLDFLCFLSLSGSWTAWRHRFSLVGLVLSALAFVGGAGFLLPYLLILTFTERGDMPSVLLGRQRASRGQTVTG